MTSLQFANAVVCLGCVFFWLSITGVLVWLIHKIWGLDKFVGWIDGIMERLGLD